MRIIAVANVLDALTSNAEVWPKTEALGTINNDAGKHFDPTLEAILH